METDPRHLIGALRASHNALLTQVSALSPEQLGVDSYCTGWDLGQLLSHIGSGAEIGLTNLERALVGADPLGGDDYPIIWGQWNALTQGDKASQMVVWDRRSVSVLQALDDRDLSSLRIPFFGMDLDVGTFAGFRLSEHAIHSWDVAVTFDPAAEVLESSVSLLVDRLGFIVERLGKAPASGAHRLIEVRTTNPERRFLLAIKDKARLSEEPAGDDEAGGRLTLPAAAFIRLVYGRLDPDHTPGEVKSEGEADLEELRQVFPGF